MLGIKLIEKAAELQKQKAIDFVNSNTFGAAQKRAMLTPKVKEKIDNLICRWKNDKIGFITKKQLMMRILFEMLRNYYRNLPHYGVLL